MLEAAGTPLTNKYAEGYPGKRYYGGCQYVDIVENLAIDRAKELFGCEFANVQPNSGSQMNQAVFLALLKPGDTLSDGLLTVIGPIQEREESENDNSLVLVASGGGGKMLLTGDMEYDEENDLLAAGVIPSCEVLKVGHHGRDDATSAALVAAVQPKVAVISTSSVILPESPAKRVLRVLSSAGAQIVQTQQAEIGVRVTLSGGNVTVEFLNN